LRQSLAERRDAVRQLPAAVQHQAVEQVIFRRQHPQVASNADHLFLQRERLVEIAAAVHAAHRFAQRGQLIQRQPSPP